MGHSVESVFFNRFHPCTWLGPRTVRRVSTTWIHGFASSGSVYESAASGSSAWSASFIRHVHHDKYQGRNSLRQKTEKR